MKPDDPSPLRSGETQNDIFIGRQPLAVSVAPYPHGIIAEKNWYFEAEILGRDQVIIDRVIVDKRSGRIRSIY